MMFKYAIVAEMEVVGMERLGSITIQKTRQARMGHMFTMAAYVNATNNITN
jgi:hypothetical protein